MFFLNFHMDVGTELGKGKICLNNCSKSAMASYVRLCLKTKRRIITKPSFEEIFDPEYRYSSKNKIKYITLFTKFYFLLHANLHLTHHFLLFESDMTGTK